MGAKLFIGISKHPYSSELRNELPLKPCNFQNGLIFGQYIFIKAVPLKCPRVQGRSNPGPNYHTPIPLPPCL